MKTILDLSSAKAFRYFMEREKRWEKIDNIDFGGLVDAAKEAVKEHEYCYYMANYDVLAMILAADVLEEKDAERSRKFLEETRSQR